MTTGFATTQRPAPRSAGFAYLLDWAVRSHARAAALLVALALLALLPGFGQIPPVDRDEARFAQATKQMLETGDLVDIRFQDQARYQKPVGIYWLQAAVVSLAEHAGAKQARVIIWLYRIPSLIGAVGAVLLTYWAALAFTSRRGALLAGVMLATSILLGVEARLATTDAMLLLACTAALGALARAYRGKDLGGWKVPLIFWAALAGGVLLKGPVILLFVGLTIATLAIADRSAAWLRTLKPLAGLVLLLVLVMPWFVAIALKSGEAFFNRSVGGDLLPKLVSAQESHGMPPGYYFVLFWITFFPGAILAPLAAPSVWRARREPGAKFLLAWIVPAWIVLEIVITKLPHYVLPLYPAIAILIAGVIDHGGLSRNRWLVRGTAWWPVIVLALFAVAVGLHIYVAEQAGFLAWPFGVGAVILALFAWWLYELDGAEQSLLRAAAATVLLSVAFFGATVPAIPELFPSAQLARALRASGCRAPEVATVGYYEPSLVFLTGTRTLMSDAAGAADFLQGDTCRFALVDSRFERYFALRAEAIGLRYSAGPRIRGFNLSSGHDTSIAMFYSGLGR
jgi:4-amino-4-deoxy-L-arabinose transferase-like glycosyltransferase